MATIVKELEPRVRVLRDAEVRSALEELQEKAGTYEELLEKAKTEALSPEERSFLRQMRNLIFLLQ